MVDVRTFRARTLQEALVLVRRELGPDAAVLQTRQVRRGLWNWLTGRSEVEIVASGSLHVPSRLSTAVAAGHTGHAVRPPSAPRSRSSQLTTVSHVPGAGHRATRAVGTTPVVADDLAQNSEESAPYAPTPRSDLEHRLACLQQMVEKLYQTNERQPRGEMSDELFRLFTQLLDADVGEETARQLIERLRSQAAPEDLDDPMLLRARLARLVEEEIRVAGPIRLIPRRRRVVALVGPTGVGKTTTIAKLAANFHLRDRCRVGLITVDTYRVAAVEQLRTYADIIDLPMEVVAQPAEMQPALERMADLDLVLLDTAGRSPRDDLKIHELKAMLAEARADEIHLVLSAVASLSSHRRAIEQFDQVGATAMLLTKLDEATSLGTILPMLRASRLPISYVTYGQNVPDDIEPAQARKLARLVLGMESLP
jgi:flagellar biosynthesis protein FlhF